MIDLCLDKNAKEIDASSFVAQNAVIIGDVHIQAKASIWFGVVIRGDTEKIRIGTGSNIQDGSVIHADPGFPCEIGENVTVGHRCVVHGALIEDGAMIGMSATVLNGAVIGAESIIGAGALISEGKIIPPRSLVVGVPGRVKRELSEQECQVLKLQALHYVDSGAKYKECGYEESIP